MSDTRQKPFITRNSELLKTKLLKIKIKSVGVTWVDCLNYNLMDIMFSASK